MHERFHATGTYKAALAEKLKRFRASGVTDIGRQAVRDREFNRTEVHRDTRVVFVQGMNGTKTAWYQSQEGDFSPGVIKPCDPGTQGLALPDYKNAVCKFGPRDPREAARLDRPVPAEFEEAAIARSEQRWGPIETIEDPYVAYVRSLGVDVEKMRQPVAKQNSPAPTSVSADSVFAKQPPGPWRDAGGNGLPPNSIFAATTKSAASTSASTEHEGPVQSDEFAMFMKTPEAMP